MKIYLVLLFVSLSLQAQDFTFDKVKGKAVPNYIAEIKVLKGEAFKQTNGKKTQVEIGTRFLKSDTLITQEKSMVKIMLVDDTIISLGPKSELNFTDMTFNEKDDRQLVVSLVKGQLTGHVKNKAKPGEVSFRTKLATMGVRGTQILINHQTINQMEISEFALLTGSADVEDNKKVTHPLSASDKITIVQNNTDQKSLQEISKLSDSEFKNLNRTDINEDLEFRPFLPYFEVKGLNQSSSLFPLFHGSSGAIKVSEQNDKGERLIEEKKGSFHNLEKLNEKLRKNQDR